MKWSTVQCSGVQRGSGLKGRRGLELQGQLDTRYSNDNRIYEKLREGNSLEIANQGVCWIGSDDLDSAHGGAARLGRF